MNPSDAFSELIKAYIGPMLKECGFSKRKNTFFLKHKGNWGLIDVQKSRKSNASLIIFTINVGTISDRIMQFYVQGRESASPSIEDCHWRERVGFLLSEREDKWWSITKDTSIERLASEVCRGLQEIVIPKLLKYIQDASLRDLWIAGRSPGLTELQRLLNLSILLKTLGPDEKMDEIVEQLNVISNGKPSAAFVKSHLLRLGK